MLGRCVVDVATSEPKEFEARRSFRRIGAMLNGALRYLKEHERQSVTRLGRLLRIPSVSTETERRNDILQAARWIHEFFQSSGIHSQILDTRNHPCIVADSGPNGHLSPTLLVYGHYDVQPIGDATHWESPPFEPVVRSGAIFARGASDDKGQLFAHLLAAEAWLKTAGALPIRVKYLIEGEEEIGSPNMRATLSECREQLACDYVVVSDGCKFDVETPTIVYATRGFLGKEIMLTGPTQDLHSGEFGGAVSNPASALASIVAGLHDKDGRVAIPGFYDGVASIDPAERKRLNDLPFDDASFLAFTGSPCLSGESGFGTLERCWVRPTLEVNGLASGFTGTGMSSIVPAKATAKLSMRLVSNQDPAKLSDAFDRYVCKICPPAVRLDIIDHAACPAYVTPIDTAGVNAAVEALQSGFGRRPLLSRAGGSLPILMLFKEFLGVDTLLMGFSVPGCNMHGPNEFLVLEDFHAGARTAAILLERLAKVRSHEGTTGNESDRGLPDSKEDS